MKKALLLNTGMRAVAVLIMAIFVLLCSYNLPASAFSEKGLFQGYSEAFSDPMTEPLSPDDPRAKLDPELLNVPPVSEPEAQVYTPKQSSRQVNREVHYDASTASEVEVPESGKRMRVQKNFKTPGYTGSVPEQVEPTGANAPLLKTIIGPDNRTRINNTADYPWRTIAKLYMTYPNNTGAACSGTIISPSYVLTAGHCVYSKANGGWATRVEVIPGLNETYKPYGSAYMKYARSYTGWTVNSDIGHDFALITLDRAIGNSTGWLGYATYSTVNGLTGNMPGYPGDKGGGAWMYYTSGPITSSSSTQLFYYLDTYPGQSGSGIYRNTTSGRYVFGINNWQWPTYNAGVRIDTTKFNSIRSWIASGY